MIKWIYKPNGICPVQAEGYFMGHYFYFRARHERVTIDFSKDEESWWNGNIEKLYLLKRIEEAGWLSEKKCIRLIRKGCLMFLLRIKSNYK
jgi:hypothetical protein